MVGAIVQGSLQADHGITGQRALLNGFLNALLNGGVEVLGDGAAEDFLGEDHVVLLLLRLEANPDVAELAAAAGLLLVTAVSLYLLLDLLPVGDLRRIQHGVHAEAALQLGDQHVQLLIAGAGDDLLLGLGVVGQGEGGIFLVQTVQAGADLVFLTLHLGGDGHGIAGSGVGDLLQGDDLSGVAQGVAGADLVHLADGADVAAAQSLDFRGLLAAHGVESAELFGLAGAGVDQSRIGGDLTGEHLDVGILAVLVGDGLPHIGAGNAAGGDDELFGLAVGSGSLMVVALHGVGQQVDDVVHEHQAAKAGQTGTAQHGEQAQILHALMQAGDHFPVSKVAALEEAIHQSLVGLGNGFLQRVVELLDDGHLISGNVDLHTLQVLHLVGALVQHVDDAGDLMGGIPDGDDDGGDLVAVLLPQSVEGGVVVGIVLVYLGDVDETGHVPVFAVFPCLLKANGDAVLGRANQNGGVGGAERLHDGTGEVERAGGIQQVDLHVVIFQRNDGGGDRNMTADLLGVVIADGVSVGVLADAVDCAGHVKQALSQRGLAAAAVTQQTDIADGINSVHCGQYSFREGKPSIWGAGTRIVTLYTKDALIAMLIFVTL